MSDKDWLQNLKVGDKVICHFRDYISTGEVTKLTKTMIVVSIGGNVTHRYRRLTGHLITTDSYYFGSLDPVTPEALAQIEEERYRRVFANKLSHLSWADVPLDRIKEIREIIEPYIKRKENK